MIPRFKYIEMHRDIKQNRWYQGLLEVGEMGMWRYSTVVWDGENIQKI